MTAGEPRSESFPPWNYIDLLMLVAMGIPCFVGMIVTLKLATLTPMPADARAWVGMLSFYILWIGSLYLILKSRHFDQPFWITLGWVYPSRGVLACILGGPILAITVGLVGALLQTPMVDMPIKDLLKGRLSVALFGVFSIILGPVVEELAFRGFLMPLLSRTFGSVLGILLTAAPFGLLHGAQYGWHWQYVVLVGMAGVVFGIARAATGSTLASTFLHSSYNMTFYVAYVSGNAAL